MNQNRFLKKVTEINKPYLKKLISLTCVFMQLSLISLPAFADDANSNTSVTVQQETVQYEYVNISSENELIAFGNSCRMDTYSINKIVSLTDDIVLTKEFTPIPIFSGIFDGKGHSISNLYMTGKVTVGGMFGILTDSASVINLSLHCSVLPTGEIQECGGIAGQNNGYIANCAVSGVVQGHSNVGGVCGINNGTVEECINYAQVNTDCFDGTILSQDLSGIDSETIQNIISTGSTQACQNVGGICGNNTNYINSCKNMATIGTSKNGFYVGGIAGRNEGFIETSTNSASIYGKSHVGGIVGNSAPYVYVSYSKDLMEQPQIRIDNLLNMIDGISDNLDDDTGNITNALNTALNTVSVTSTYAAQVVNQATIFANGKLDEVNEIAGLGNEVLEGLDYTSISISDATKDINAGLENFENAIKIAGQITKDNAVEIIQKCSEYTAKGVTDITNAVSDINIAVDDVSVMLGNLSDTGIGEFSQLQPEFMQSVNMLSSNISLISKQLQGLVSAVKNTETNITGTIRNITDEARSLSDSIFEAVYSFTDLSITDIVHDVSGEYDDVDHTAFGTIYNCCNTGSVDGIENVGGIVGSCALKNIFEMNEANERSGLAVASVRYRDLLSCCRNYGNITAQKNNVGCICGTQNFGAILNCQGYGTAVSTEGENVGGVVGKCNGLIRDCFVRSDLYGCKFVGGICGESSNGSSISSGTNVIDCYSKVKIYNCEEFNGGISGSDKGSYLDNYFVSDTLNGIGTYSLIHGAAPISDQTLLSAENCPNEFSWSEEQLRSSATYSITETVQYSSTEQLIMICAMLITVVAAIILIVILFGRTRSREKAK